MSWSNLFSDLIDTKEESYKITRSSKNHGVKKRDPEENIHNRFMLVA